MTITREFLQAIRESEQPFIRKAIELGEHFAAVRKRVADEGGDWSVLKALLKAEILDEEGGEHVKKLIDRVNDGAAYADMLRINKKIFSSDASNEGRRDATGPKHAAPAETTGTVSDNSDALAIETPTGPSQHDSDAAAEMAPSVSAASISDDEFNTIPVFARRDPDDPVWRT